MEEAVVFKILVDGIDVLGVKAPSPTILTLPLPGTDVPMRPVMLGPNITGQFNAPYNNTIGAIKAGEQYFVMANGNYYSTGNVIGYRQYFNASNSSSIYGNSSTVQPRSLSLSVLIKY